LLGLLGDVGGISHEIIKKILLISKPVKGKIAFCQGLIDFPPALSPPQAEEGKGKGA